MSDESDRSIVLERLRTARTAREAMGASDGLRPAVEPAAIAAPTPSTEPRTVTTEEPVARIPRFARGLELVNGVCHRATSDAAAAEALLSIVRDRQASVIARSDDELVIKLLEGVAGGFVLLSPGATRTELLGADIGVTRATIGIAEYGTIMLESGDAAGHLGRPTERNRLAALVPEIHVAVLAASDLVDTWDEALASSRRPGGGPPPTVTFATGPSRTADIEMELVLGVHGPRAQHVIVLEHR